MKLLVEVSNKSNLYLDYVSGIILPLDKYSVESTCFFTMDEIRDIVSNSKNEVFVKINKNLENDDIEDIKNILIELDSIGVNGVFFYDLAWLIIMRHVIIIIVKVVSMHYLVKRLL